MRILHIIGRKKHGKTTLVTELLRELVGRGVRVGTLKHSGHDHELDTPGKDSFLHRQAGASPVAVVTPSLAGLYQPREESDDPYAAFAPMFRGCDLVLVEGNVEGPGPKIEVWRRERCTSPLAAERADVVGVASDDSPEVDVPVWPRDDVVGLAERVLDLAREIPAGEGRG